MSRRFSFILFSCLALVVLAVFFVNAQTWEPYVDPNSVTPVPVTSTPTPEPNSASNLPFIAGTIAESVSDAARAIAPCKVVAKITPEVEKLVSTSVDIAPYTSFRNFVLIVRDSGGRIKDSTMFQFIQNPVLGDGAWTAWVENYGPKKNSVKSEMGNVVSFRGVNGDGYVGNIIPDFLIDDFVTYPALGLINENNASLISLYYDDTRNKNNKYITGRAIWNPVSGLFGNKKKRHGVADPSVNSIELYAC